jgi:3',5'-cyclic AMP phosphodiesterase CpdA
LLLSSLQYAQQWSFSLVGDPRSGHRDFKSALLEMKKTVIGDKNIPPMDFLVVTGDFDPPDENYQIFKDVFVDAPEKPSLYPAIGNHDLKYFEFMLALIFGQKGSPHLYDSSCYSFYVDWKNARFIFVDQYKTTGFKSGCINQTGLQWIEKAINSADTLKHIFIAFHEPAFARFRHVGDSFDGCPAERDQFWNMIVRHKDKVRAVLVGHTHFYYAMKVRDPEGTVRDVNKLPIEEGGIYQIDPGAAGNQADKKITLVRFIVSDENVKAIVLQADSGDNNFTTTAEFDLN